VRIYLRIKDPHPRAGLLARKPLRYSALLARHLLPATAGSPGFLSCLPKGKPCVAGFTACALSVPQESVPRQPCHRSINKSWGACGAAKLAAKKAGRSILPSAIASGQKLAS